MGGLLGFSVVAMLASTVVGIIVGHLILRWFRLYDRLPKKVALALKIMTLGPPLALAMVGLSVSLESFIWMIFYYLIAGLLAGFGCVLAYRDQSQGHVDRQVGFCLMIAAALPFIWIGFNAFVSYFEPGTFSFHIQNYSDHEIDLKEVQVDGQVIFIGEHKAKYLFLRDGFSRWPRKIKLLAYDAKLQKEVRGNVSLPFSQKYTFCPFYVVYEPGGFRNDDQPCP